MVLTHFRLTDPDRSNLEDVTLWLRSEGVLHISVFEVSINEVAHMHAVIEIQNISTSRKHFLKKFPKYHGNSSYTWAVCRETIYHNLCYCCKGKSLGEFPIVLANPKEYDIQYYHDEYWKNRGDLQNAEKKIISKRQKAKPWFEQVCDKFKERKTREYTYCRVDLEILQDFIMHELANSSKILDEFIVKRMVLGLLNAVTPSEPKHKRKLFDKMFPEFSDSESMFTYFD